MMPGTSHSQIKQLAVKYLPVCAILLVLPAAMADEAFKQGLELFQDGKYSAAREQLARSIDKKAPVMTAIVDATLGRCADALITLRAAVSAADPMTAKLAGLAAARCSIAGQKFDRALNLLATLKTQHPKDPDILYETARLHLKGWNEAISSMFNASPASYRVNQLSAEIFEIQGRSDDAVREYRKAIEKSPNTLNLHYRLGRALLLKSHEPEALAEALLEFKAELELNPNDAVAEYQAGQILQVLGKPEEAVPHFERAVALDGDFPEALVALAKEHTRAQRHQEAIQLLEHALALHPESEPAHYSLMLAYRNAGRRDDAQRIQLALEQLQATPEGEFNEFLKRIGEQP